MFNRDEARSTTGKPKCFVCGRVANIKRFAFRPEQIGRITLIKHEIKTGDAKPIPRGPYLCSSAEEVTIGAAI
jgi:hypothetical protein